MKSWALIIQFILSVSVVKSQPKVEGLLYEWNKEGGDSTLYCQIVGNSISGFKFVCQESKIITFTLTDSIKNSYDTLIEFHENEYGPYLFRRRKKEIQFKDLSRDMNWSTLYLFGSKEYLAPELFSTSTDSYNLPTSFLDSTCKLRSVEEIVNCYRFLQVIDRHYGEGYRIIFVNKETLFPVRIEYYQDRTFSKIDSEIFDIGFQKECPALPNTVIKD